MNDGRGENFFNYIDINGPNNIFGPTGKDKSCQIDSREGASKRPVDIENNERRDTRRSVFSDTSIIWKSPRQIVLRKM